MSENMCRRHESTLETNNKLACNCGFPSVYLEDYEGTSYSCNELVELESSHQVTRNSHWKIYKSSSRIEPYVGLHESFRNGTPILFAPTTIESQTLDKIVEALEKNIKNARNLLAFLTSGTTGAPKIVVHDKRTLIESAQKIANRFPQILGLKFHNLFPGTYMAGILNNGVLPFLVESPIFLDQVYNFKTPLQIGTVSRAQKTEFAWVSPAMISGICAVTKKDRVRKPSWVFALSATGPLGPLQFEEINKLEIPLRNTYGSTELLFISAQEFESLNLSCGTALENVSIHTEPFLDEQNSNNNKILVSTDTKPKFEVIWDPREKNYIEATNSLDPRDTNDVGYISNGELHLNSRSDDLVVLGGVNFSLGELERYATQFRGVLEACAYAPYGGTFADLILCYETSNQQSVDPTEFRDFISAKYGQEYSPRKLLNMDLPRTHHGKINRAKVAESLKH